MYTLTRTFLLIFKLAVTVARAFTTSQSAFAHYMLFKLIFSIVEQDTGRQVHFRHIHGDGIETITADGHRGQAMGKLNSTLCITFF